MKSMFIRLGLLALFITSLSGCSGSDGSAGPAGANGTNGTSAGTNASTMSPTAWANSQFSGQVTGVTIGSDGKPVVSFKVTDKDGNPVTGLGNTALSAANAASGVPAALQNVYFTMAKLIPGASGSPARWVSYIVTSNPTATAPTPTPRTPTTETVGTMVDNGDGTYKYTFFRAVTGGTGSVQETVNNFTYTGNNIKADLDDLTYDANATHRVAVVISGNARNTGTNTPDASTSTANPVAVALKTPVNFFYDFIPATGAVATDAQSKHVVDVNNCFSCHGGKFAGIAHGGSVLTGVGGTRQNTKLCVTCHTQQTVYGRGEATVTATSVDMKVGTTTTNYKISGQSPFYFPRWIHMIHMGENKAKTYLNPVVVALADARFPQDQRNCTKCHSNAPQADNWKTVPNRLACGGCHDGIDFATGTGYSVKQHRAARAMLTSAEYPATPAKITAKMLTLTPSGHLGGVQTSDANCALCHTADVIATQHKAVTTPIPAEATGYQFAPTVGNLPTGAKQITYVLNSVTLNASRNPVYKFKLQADGADVVFNTPSTTAELMNNFVGSTSLYVTFSVPRDGLAAPADWNAYVNADLLGVFRGTSGTIPASGVGAGTLSAAPDASGYYTLTQVGAAIPANATNMTGWMGLATGFAQTNIAGYAKLNVPAEAVSVVVTSTGNVARRAIVEKARCNSCHSRLGVFTSKVFHGGQRNNPQACAMCHRPDQTSGGWSSASIAYIHGIHGSAKRTVPFTWHTSNLGDETGNALAFQELGYPGLLRNCQQCHLPNTVNFGTGTAANNSNAKWAYENGNVPYYTVGQNKYLTAQTYNGYTYNAASGVCATSTTATTVTAAADAVTSPYVTKGAFATTTDYGPGFAYNFGAVAGTTSCTNSGVVLPGLAPGATREAADTTLVNSPIANACFACHTTPVAMSHMRGNGGYLYASRATVKAENGGVMGYREACIVCHGAGKVADAEVIHAQTMK